MYFIRSFNIFIQIYGLFVTFLLLIYYKEYFADFEKYLLYFYLINHFCIYTWQRSLRGSFLTI